MSEASKNNKSSNTLCWNCAHATGGCRWSDYLKPVRGWTATPTKKLLYGGAEYCSYIVTACPEFKRDAYNNGLKRVGDGSIYDTMSKNS